MLIGAGERNRTLDLLITSELLYQLSYTGSRAVIAVMTGEGFALYRNLARCIDIARR